MNRDASIYGLMMKTDEKKLKQHEILFLRRVLVSKVQRLRVASRKIPTLLREYVFVFLGLLRLVDTNI